MKRRACICLTKAEIDGVLPRLAKPLDRYLWLQEHREKITPTFRGRFNYFYNVTPHRDGAWQRKFYCLMNEQREARHNFADVLAALHDATGQVEASFASKLVATYSPKMPVIDSRVFANIGLQLPRPNIPQRLAVIESIYGELRVLFRIYLRSPSGRYLVRQFKMMYPAAPVTDTKMLDCVLWKLRR